MRKTTITAAALAMSASLAGLAYAAAPDGRSTDDSSVVTTFSPASDSSSSPSSTAPEVSPTTADDGRHGADDPVGHDVGDDHGGGGHGADDTIAPTPRCRPSTSATTGPTTVPATTWATTTAATTQVARRRRRPGSRRR